MNQPIQNSSSEMHVCPFCGSSLETEATACPSCKAERTPARKDYTVLRVSLLICPLIYAVIGYYFYQTEALDASLLPWFALVLAVMAIIDIGLYVKLGRGVINGYRWKKAQEPTV